MPERIVGRIAPRGGRLATADRRIALDLPADVFDEEVDVTLESLDAAESLEVDGQSFWSPWHVRLAARLPDGQPYPGRFRARPLLSFRYTADDLRLSASKRVYVFGRAAPDDAWRLVPSVDDREGMVATAELTHFSEYRGGIPNDQALLPSVESFQTDLNTGSASLSIPLKLPPGTNGFAPRLTLTYSSGGPNGLISEMVRTYSQSQAAWVGFGWQLDVGQVEVTEADTAGERAHLVLNGRNYELIRENPDWSKWRTQEESFLKIRRLNQWEGGAQYQ